jgi:hypothetical protein
MKFFRSKKPHYEHLKKKWSFKNKDLKENLLNKHLKNFAAGTLGGLVLLTTPATPLASSHLDSADKTTITSDEDKNKLVALELKDKLPNEVGPLTPEQEQKIGGVLSNRYGVKASAELEGKRLNRSYGLIGGEQHLYRYPGDTVQAHARDAQDWAMFGGAGIAPGLGAWGYFAPSKEAFNKEAEERERWYVVAQTFLSPGFAERTGEYRDFYKYRKFLVVNPKTGQAVVGDLGDAGPGESTGKSFGGSPEVMHELGLATGPRKGEVLFFFIDDPENKIPLGPIKPVEASRLASNR